MCELCGSGEDKRLEIIRCHRVSESLAELSRYYNGLATGSIKPHSDATMNRVKPAAIRMIRELVMDWAQ